MNNGVLVDTMIKDALWDAFNDYHMIKTADNICEEWGITREDLDEFALKSQQKACAAIEAGAFKDEIVPVEIKKKKETIVFDTDEGPRAGSTIEGLAKLRAINPDGFVTAGNASGINDGAAAIVVMSEEKAKELGVTPMATWVAGGLAGVIFSLFEKKLPYVGAIFSLVLVPIINTGLFVLFAQIFFVGKLENITTDGSAVTLSYIIVSMIGINFIFEFLVNSILSPVVFTIYKYFKMRN